MTNKPASSEKISDTVIADGYVKVNVSQLYDESKMQYRYPKIKEYIKGILSDI